MFKIGLTGNYLTGLDYVSDIFRRYKVPLFDADLVVKYMLYNSSDHIKKIRDIFGDDVFTNNIIDLSTLNGTDKHTGMPRFHVLLKLLEKDLITYYEAWRLKHKNEKFTIFKSQILFEFGFNKNMNFNISVFIPEGMRITELQTHQGIKVTDAYALLGTEMDPYQKNKHCNYVIHNYDTYMEKTERQISQIYRSLLKKYEDSKPKLVTDF